MVKIVALSSTVNDQLLSLVSLHLEVRDVRTPSLLDDADVVLILYDQTDTDTLEELAPTVSLLHSQNVPMVAFGYNDDEVSGPIDISSIEDTLTADTDVYLGSFTTGKNINALKEALDHYRIK